MYRWDYKKNRGRFMIDKIKEFIEDNINLIEQDTWDDVYRKANNDLKGDTGKFTEIMFEVDIHPEFYLKELPKYFLYHSTIKEFTIPRNITSIGTCAFCACYSLTSVTIPDSVTFIGASAFDGCNSLTSVTIPDSVTSIGSSAFQDCLSLTSIVIPDSVVSIGDEAFRNCINLTSAMIGDSIETVSYSAFFSCDSLTDVKIGAHIKVIDDSAFTYCDSLTNVIIPDSVTSIGDYAFNDCGDNLVIEYQGNKDDWRKIYNKEAFQDTYFTIKCIDGKIVKNR